MQTSMNRNPLKWNTPSKITWTAVGSTYVGGNRTFSPMKRRKMKRTSRRIVDAYSKTLLIISTQKIENLTSIDWPKPVFFVLCIFNYIILKTSLNVYTYVHVLTNLTINSYLSYYKNNKVKTNIYISKKVPIISTVLYYVFISFIWLLRTQNNECRPNR